MKAILSLWFATPLSLVLGSIFNSKVIGLTDTKGPSLLKNMSMLTSSLGLGMVLGLILRVYIPRVLGIEAVGEYYYAASIASLITTFYGLGLSIIFSGLYPLNQSWHKRTFPDSEFPIDTWLSDLSPAGCLFYIHESDYFIAIFFLVIIRFQ